MAFPYFDATIEGTGGFFKVLGEWLRIAAWNVTHEPIWAGTAITVVLGVVVLAVLRRRAAGE
jgi:hypothetical protein